MSARAAAETPRAPVSGAPISGSVPVAARHAPEPEIPAATSVPTGRLGIWWFLASEIVIFGGLITTYVLYRLRHPEWGQEAAHTFTPAGAFNTLVLLTSSLCMVLAHDAVERGEPSRAVRRMLEAVALGGVFLGVKVFEYTHEILEGFTPVSGLFWSFYYAMTGLHALHVLGGMVAILVVRHAAARGLHLRRVEYVGIYWRFVDIVWIFLFPLLYLASRS